MLILSDPVGIVGIAVISYQRATRLVASRATRGGAGRGRANPRPGRRRGSLVDYPLAAPRPAREGYRHLQSGWRGLSTVLGPRWSLNYDVTFRPSIGVGRLSTVATLKSQLRRYVQA